MGERVSLRRIGAPVVAGAPSGVRVRTRIHLTEVEAAALRASGHFWVGVPVELAGRCDGACWIGSLMRGGEQNARQAITVVSSSSGGGDHPRRRRPVPAGHARLAAHVSDLRRAVDVLEARCAVRPGESAPAGAGDRGGPGSSASRVPIGERTVRQDPPAGAAAGPPGRAEEVLTAGRPSITVGGKRLWRNSHHLEAAELSVQQWQSRWDAAGCS